jgi:hypothetical protein
MELYKRSCPFCGQHIEYTVGYCGKQMVCPICGKSVTFPATPPGGKGLSLHINRPEAARASNRSFSFQGILDSLRKFFSSEGRGPAFDFDGILASLRRFKHWNAALACLVPFIIVGALLAGAAVVKKQFGNAPATPVAPLIRADPHAWQKMTDLARADQLVQEQLGVVRKAVAAVAIAEQNRARLHAYWHVRRAADQTIYNSVMAQYNADDQAVANAQQALASARQCFENRYQNYQKLGGTIDYRQQLPQ